MQIGVRVDDVPIGKDDFEVSDVVAGQAVKTSVVRIPSTSQEAAYTDVTIATAENANRVTQKLLIYIATS